MPKTILQRWENLFGSEAGGNNSPDSLAAKSNGTDGDGLSGTAAISHTNPLNKASALDEGYDSSRPLSPGYHDGNVKGWWDLLVSQSEDKPQGTDVTPPGKNRRSDWVAKGEAIRRAGITPTKYAAQLNQGIASSRSYPHIRGNHRLIETDIQGDKSLEAAAFDTGRGA